MNIGTQDGRPRTVITGIGAITPLGGVDEFWENLKNGVSVEIVVHASPRQTFVAKNHDDDMYACIDHCIDKIAQQLRKYKDKLRDHKQRPTPAPESADL